jgi:hypothetical protein
LPGGDQEAVEKRDGRAGSEKIIADPISEVIQYRSLDRQLWMQQFAAINLLAQKGADFEHHHQHAKPTSLPLDRFSPKNRHSPDH